MAKREITWSKNSVIQLHEILEYYTLRNKSNSYSIKLYQKFKTELSKTFNPFCSLSLLRIRKINQKSSFFVPKRAIPSELIL